MGDHGDWSFRIFLRKEGGYFFAQTKRTSDPFQTLSFDLANAPAASHVSFVANSALVTD